MNYELPESFYSERKRRSLNLRRLRVWSILVLLFCVANLFTPYGLIRRNRISAEFPNSEFGIQRAYITEGRELVLERRGYVDRMSKYGYDRELELSAYREHDFFSGVHVDSNPSISSQYRTIGVVLDIKPGLLTLEKIRHSSHRLRGKQPANDRTDTGVVLNESGEADIRSLKETHYEEPPIDNLQLRFISEDAPDPIVLLPGHQYLPFKDAHCYTDELLGEQYQSGTLYITTDAQRYLHRIEIHAGQDEDKRAMRLVTVSLADLALERHFDSSLLHDPDRPELILLNSDGGYYRFDDQSLALLESGLLEGNWQREYASLFQSTGFYSEDFGIPLNRVQAFRIYRVLAVLLLLSLILLILGYMPGTGPDASDEQESDNPDNTSAEPEITVSQLRL
ncbi:hypothetical protein KDL29_00790 [bacterium]|nr:hypothetical protein [bacterium]